MRRAAGAGDDAAQPARAGVLGIFQHVVRHAVRGEHAGLVRDAECLELGSCVAHDVPVAVAPDDADQRGVLRYPSVLLSDRTAKEPRANTQVHGLGIGSGFPNMLGLAAPPMGFRRSHSRRMCVMCRTYRILLFALWALGSFAPAA
jgi:hypothetical protein